jgi:hypothetical protein
MNIKKLFRRLAKVRHAVYGNVLMGVITTVAGLIQANHAFMLGGITWVLVSISALVATHLVEPVLEGVVVELQQPQLPDVQVHMRRTYDLSQAA